jgi:hypothetical protein
MGCAGGTTELSWIPLFGGIAAAENDHDGDSYELQLAGGIGSLILQAGGLAMLVLGLVMWRHPERTPPVAFGLAPLPGGGIGLLDTTW